MQRIEKWDGQAERFPIEFETVEVNHSSLANQSTKARASLVCKYDIPDRMDYIFAASSGILTGLIDSFWTGEFSLSNAQEWGREKANDFVLSVAHLRGYKKEDLEGAIRYLEKNAPMPSDQLSNIWGGGLQHHFRDFAHHASIVGLIFSLLTQFTGLSYGTNTDGFFEIHELPDTELIGNNIEEKLYNGIVMWFLHLISDMAGSSSSAGKGTGIPGPILSFAKELSVLPGIRNLKLEYNEASISFSVMLSKIFNGTAFDHTNSNDLKRFDLRTEMGIYANKTKLSVPVVLNQCLIRAYYFVRRLCMEINTKNIHKISDIQKLDSTHFLPRNNICIRRMATIATGVFCVADISDAAIRAFLHGAKSKTGFASEFLLRANFVGMGSFVISLKNDIVSSVFGKELLPEERIEGTNESILAFENAVLEVDFNIDATGIYEYSFYRMYQHVKVLKKELSEAARVYRNIQNPILKLEDDETELYDMVAKDSYHSLIVETEKLMMELLAFYGISYIPFTNNEQYDFYTPFYRIEDRKKIAYVFSTSIIDSIDWEKIKDVCGIDGIKVVAMVELGTDDQTRDLLIAEEEDKTGGFVKLITLQDLFSLISDKEYQIYKKYVEQYNADIKKLIGYRTIVAPSESSLQRMKVDIEAEMRNRNFASMLRADHIYERQIQKMQNNFWDRELYKAMIGNAIFAESFISSEWYYQTHKRLTDLEQTAIVTGYLKSVEQLLYKLLSFSVNTGKTIKRKGGDKAGYIDYCNDNLGIVDTSLGSMIGYARYYSDLWDVNQHVKNYIVEKLTEYREIYRNEYFHKDNITSETEIDEIRDNTLLIHFLLLSAMKIRDDQKKEIGIIMELTENKKEGLQYEKVAKWLDRILCGDVLLSPESNIHFDVSTIGYKENRQCKIVFTTVSGFSKEGLPENIEWPYIGDDFIWDAGEEDRATVEAQAIEMISRYLKEGEYSHVLMKYRSVTVGWYGNHTIIHQK